PQGRDINESGPKSVTLVTVRDDRTFDIDERLTGLAQFERVPVDVTGLETWSEIVRKIGETLSAHRDAAMSPHLVARLLISGSTSLSFRLRRDRDQLQAEAQEVARSIGKTWIDKVEVDCTLPQSLATSSSDPLLELRTLMHDQVLPSASFAEAVREIARELEQQLPAESRRIFGEDDETFNAAIRRLSTKGVEEVLARLGNRHGEEPA
ncbi:MAG TPA: hypothetical protein VGC41_15730, partial [Kofleriaceae bacterium]